MGALGRKEGDLKRGDGQGRKEGRKARAEGEERRTDMAKEGRKEGRKTLSEGKLISLLYLCFDKAGPVGRLAGWLS